LFASTVSESTTCLAQLDGTITEHSAGGEEISMGAVKGLGYLGLGVKDLDVWESFATEILGMQSGGRTNDGRLLLRMDEYTYRLALHRDESDDIIYAGWEVADGPALREIAERLRGIGVEVSPGTAEQAKVRRVTELLRLVDPGGLPTEVFYGPLIQFEKPFHSPRTLSGFVTGQQGLGHIVMTVPDIEKSLWFYLDGLGFRISDTIEMKLDGGVQVTMPFMHCNSRHHTLALVPASTPKRLNHIMMQVRSIDDVGSTMYLVQDRKLEIVATLGRHTNDHMFSFYLRTPSDFAVEYGWGGREVDDTTWHVQKHSAASIWGHRRLGLQR
jgi:2,3-dihydroxybiphenyl 1,2-dioxygenase